MGVSGGRDRRHPQRADRDCLAVRDWLMLKLNFIRCVDEVDSILASCQHQTAGQVVIVQMGFRDVRDSHTSIRRSLLNPVRITLRIDDQRHLPVMHEIRAVSKLRSINHNHIHKFLLLNMHERPGQALVFTGKTLPPGV